jgi:hypothetical protein
MTDPTAKPPTDLEAFTALWDDIPGTPDEWNALATRADMLHKKVQTFRNNGGAYTADDTIGAHLAGHLRNVTRALKEMAWSLSSVERGDDPDIPF